MRRIRDLWKHLFCDHWWVRFDTYTQVCKDCGSVRFDQ